MALKSKAQCVHPLANHNFKYNSNEKSTQRDANTARTLAVVRFGHRPPTATNPQTGPIIIHCGATAS